jgi:hypothetical protein
MNVKAGDLKKTEGPKYEAPVKSVIKKKTDSEIYLENCDEEQAEIFNDIKAILMAKDKGNKHEFEAVNKERFDDFDHFIRYIINNVITIEEDGISVNLRQPLENSDGIVITDSIKVLFARNEAREKQFKNSVKTLEKNKDYDSDMGAAVIAASFADVGNKMISANLFYILKNTNPQDYTLIVRVYGFFRQ